MSVLGQVVEAVGSFNRTVEEQVSRAGSDKKFAGELRRRWREIQGRIPIVETPTGIKLPRLALPQTNEAGEIARYLFGEGLPGEFPFVNAAYPEMYLGDNSGTQIANSKQNPKSKIQ